VWGHHHLLTLKILASSYSRKFQEIYQGFISSADLELGSGAPTKGYVLLVAFAVEDVVAG
jgi:hypothetical protein